MEFSGPALGDMFITFLMGVLDPREHTLTLVNAGAYAAPIACRQKSGATSSRIWRGGVGPACWATIRTRSMERLHSVARSLEAT